MKKVGAFFKQWRVGNTHSLKNVRMASIALPIFQTRSAAPAFHEKNASSFFHVTLLVPPLFFPTVFFWEIVVSDGVCKRHAHKFQIPTVGKIRRFSHDRLTFPHLFPIEYR